MPAFPSPGVQASATLQVPRVGRCKTCGRQVPGIFVPNMGHLCKDECPRCGIKPFYLEHVAPYTGDTSRMAIPDAVAYVKTLDDPNEIEVTFRLEIIGHPPRGRRAFLEAAYEHYWEVAILEDPYERAEVLTLDQCIDAWIDALKDEKTRRYYRNLILAV